MEEVETQAQTVLTMGLDQITKFVYCLDQNLGMFFQVVFLRFTPPLCIYSCSPSMWDLQFSSVSWLGPSMRKWGSWFSFRKVEPSFKEFLASPAMMHLGLMSIKPDVGCTKSFSACYSLRVMPL
jgi:hypothetical protein